MTLRNRGIAVITVGLALVMALAACGGSQGGSNNAASDIRVGGVIWGRYLDYWQLVQLGMEAAAKQYNVPIQIEDSNKSLGTEAQLVSQLTARGTNVLAISPFSSDGSNTTLTTASKSMTVVQYNTQVTNPSLKNFVGADSTAVGEAIGQAAKDYIQKQMGGKATIGILADDAEPTSKEKVAGFLSVLQGLPGVNVAAQATAAKPAEGASVFPTLLQGHPNIDLVFAWNGGSLEGASTAASKMGATAHLFGIDMGTVVADSMLAGNSPIVAVADKHPYDVGFKAVELGIKLHKGQKVDPVIHPAPTVYSVTNPSAVKQWKQQAQEAANEK